MRRDEEVEFRAHVEQISRVLGIFFENPMFVPRKEDFVDLNPTRDTMKAKILKLDAVVDWRMRVYRAFRCSLPCYMDCNQNAWWAGKHVSMRFLCGRIYTVERRWHRRYLTKGECWAFWEWWWAGREGQELGAAARKIVRNLERGGGMVE